MTICNWNSSLETVYILKISKVGITHKQTQIYSLKIHLTLGHSILIYFHW